MWQALYEELAPLGFEVVTVALDTNVEAARAPALQARQTHRSLVDPALTLVRLFGITNVPFGVWIDESGTIVRPAEHAPVPRDLDAPNSATAAMAAMPEEQRRIVTAMAATNTEPGRYVEAVRDWVVNGTSSRFVLSPADVVARSRPRPPEAALAESNFELGQHLYRSGSPRDAVAYFACAHELDPTNWSYQRQARSLADPSWGQVYDRDLFAEVGRVGPETWRPALDL